MRVAVVVALVLLVHFCNGEAETEVAVAKREVPEGRPEGSNILNNDQIWEDTTRIFANAGLGEIKFRMIYQWTQSHRNPPDCHNRINNQPNTVTLFRSQSGSIFGGYTAATWANRQNYLYWNFDSFVFGLVYRGGRHLQRWGCSAYCDHYRTYDNVHYYPTWGGGHDIFGGHSWHAHGGYNNPWMYRHLAFGSNPGHYWVDGNFWFNHAEIEVYVVSGFTEQEIQERRQKREETLKKEKKGKAESKEKKIELEKTQKKAVADKEEHDRKMKEAKLEKAEKKLALAAGERQRQKLKDQIEEANNNLKRALEREKEREKDAEERKKRRVEQDEKNAAKLKAKKEANKRLEAQLELERDQAAQKELEAEQKLENVKIKAADELRKTIMNAEKQVLETGKRQYRKGYNLAAVADDDTLRTWAGKSPEETKRLLQVTANLVNSLRPPAEQ